MRFHDARHAGAGFGIAAMPSHTPKTCRRESAKTWRREAIVEATCRLLGRTPYSDMSVEMIAKLAKVSPATVFNLFGTKAAILDAVIARDAEAVRRQLLEQDGVDSLDQMFDVVRLLADCRRANPAVYANAPGAELRACAELQPLIWRRLARRAAFDGNLSAEVDDARIGRALAFIHTGALAHWLGGALPLDRLEDDVASALAAVLEPYATAKGRRRIAARLAGETRQAARTAAPAHVLEAALA